MLRRTAVALLVLLQSLGTALLPPLHFVANLAVGSSNRHGRIVRTLCSSAKPDVGGDNSTASRMLVPPTITFVSGNKKKLREVQMIIAKECDLPFNITARGDLDLDELQAAIPEEIAAAKCRLAAHVVGGPVLVDDTSLCFRALGGMPGPYIKWFQQKLGGEGLVKMVSGFEDKAAWAQCSVAFSPGPGAEPCVFIGRTDGKVVDVPCGTGGFGWDAIFQPDGFDVTFAEMDTEAKNKISHRGRAMLKFAKFLQENEDWITGRASKRRRKPRDAPRDVVGFRRRRRMI